MRRVVLAASLLFLPAPPATAAAAPPEVTVVAVADDEGGAGTVTATCAARSDASAAATTVWCETAHRTAVTSLPGPAAVAVLRAVEPGDYTVCATAETVLPDGSVRVSPRRCAPVDLLAGRSGDGCRAYADPPRAEHAFGAEAAGGFACGTPVPNLGVTVCLEVLDPEAGWVAESCDGVTDPNPATFVSAATYGCRYGLWLIRTAAVGTRDGVPVERAESEPVGYLCTPLG